MPTELTKTTRRQVKIYGVPGMINVAIGPEGLSFSVPRSSKAVTLTWAAAVKAAETPYNVPAHLFGKPTAFLAQSAEKSKKKETA